MAKKTYWERQYQMGPYGASRSTPTARRNKGTRKNKARKNLSQAQLAAGFGGTAAKNRVTRNNPWYPGTPSLYLPDTTTVRSSLVDAPVPWDDATEIFSALVPGPYGAKSAKKNSRKSRRSRKNGIALKNVGRNSKGQFVSKSRRNSRPRQAEFEKYSPETGMWPHHPMYEQVRGRFSTDEAWTHGRQPMNRRNPKRDSKGRFKSRGKSRYNPKLKRAAYLKGYKQLPDDILVDMMMDGDPAATHEWELRGARKVAKKSGWKAPKGRKRTKKSSGRKGGPVKALFPGECANCPKGILPGQQIADTGMRGPRDGKVMAHLKCL